MMLELPQNTPGAMKLHALTLLHEQIPVVFREILPSNLCSLFKYVGTEGITELGGNRNARVIQATKLPMGYS